uniref:hypothetical protein n=1 Tax=Raoultella ornithinolytica TaxID=54291 RepID=UPI0038517D87
TCNIHQHFFFFFFKQEDAIGDGSPSGGQGDVKKRQKKERENLKKGKIREKFLPPEIIKINPPVTAVFYFRRIDGNHSGCDHIPDGWGYG